MAIDGYRAIRFFTKYVVRNGETVPVDMVEYCAPGMANRAETPAPVKSLARVRPDGDPDNMAYRMARDRWAEISVAYEAWKAGQAIPVEGTPLAAWAGVTPEQADVLRNAGLRTVEDIANATDAVITRAPIPGVRDLKEQAKAFLASREGTKLAADLAEKDRKLADLESQLEEMKQLLLSQEPELAPDGSEVPRRRGRPPRTVDAVA